MNVPVTPRVRVQRPMQVRFFRDSALEPLESAVNAWLAERTDREIVEIRQSVVPGRGEPELVVSIWYIDG